MVIVVKVEDRASEGKRPETTNNKKQESCQK